MDVVKVFTEEPLGLEALVPDTEPDARRREAPPPSLEAFLSRPPEPFARVYLAGTSLGPPRRVGATALEDVSSWVRPLLDWAGDRPWSALEDEALRSVSKSEAASALGGGSAQALALGDPGARLVEAVGGERRDRLPALRSILEGGASVLFREPAHDGWDWSLFSAAPLRNPLVEAFRRHPSRARRIVAPYRRARGEHTFYLEQWMDSLPAWAETV